MNTEKETIKFLDANVIINAFTVNKDANACMKLIRQPFFTDALCLAEAHQSISRISKSKDFATGCIKALYILEGKILSLDSNLLFECLKRAERYNLSMFDLIHYVAALLNGCNEFVSYDHDFNNLEIPRTEP